MAGVKGRSGGPRKNAGGKRPGAGRKPKKATRKALPELTHDQELAIGASLPPGPDAPAPPQPIITSDAKVFLEQVLVGKIVANAEQIKAAQALLPFQHRKLGEEGKKAQRDDAARKVMGASGRFKPAPPPAAAKTH